MRTYFLGGSADLLLELSESRYTLFFSEALLFRSFFTLLYNFLYLASLIFCINTSSLSDCNG